MIKNASADNCLSVESNNFRFSGESSVYPVSELLALHWVNHREYFFILSANKESKYSFYHYRQELGMERIPM